MRTKPHAPQVGALRVVLAIAMAGSCVFAQADSNGKQLPSSSQSDLAVEETELPPVTVSAHEGIAVPYDQTGVSVTILDVPELEKQGIETVNNALTTVPGVFSLPNGATYQRGSLSYAAIRGMNKDAYTLTMVDGMRLYRADALTGAVALGTMDLFSIGSMEVVKGSQAAVYGGGSVGGVIAMNTPEGEGKPGVKIYNEVGSFDSYTGYMTSEGKQGKWDYFVGAGYERTNNDPANEAYILDRHSSKFEQWQEVVRLGYQISEDAKLTMTYRRQDAEANQPSVILNDAMWNPLGYSRAKDTYRTNLATLKLDAKINKLWSSSLMAGYYGYDFSENLMPEALKQGYVSYNSNLRNVQVEWRNLLKWSESNQTTAGFAWDRSEYASSGATSLYQKRNLENIYGFFAEHLYRPVKTWDNSLAVRLDHSTVWNNLFTYRYATSWKVTGEHSKTRVFGSVGSGYRAPTQFERYASGTYQGTRFVGNPDLKVSKSLSGDFGIERKIAASHDASVTGFWTRVNDEIVSSGGLFGADKTFSNTSHVTSVGVETALRGNFSDAWNTGYSIAYTYTVPKSAGDIQLVNTARSVWSADIHTSPIPSVTTGLGLIAAHGRTAYDGNRLPLNSGKVDGYCVLRWYAQWQATKNLTFHIRVENLTNDKFITQKQFASYLDTYSLGTAVYGGFTLTF